MVLSPNPIGHAKSRSAAWYEGPGAVIARHFILPQPEVQTC